MQVFIILPAILAIAFAKPTHLGLPITAYGPYTVASPYVLSSQYHAQDDLGQFSYGYATPLSSKTETRSIDGITRGGYVYVDAKGKLQTVQYTADAINGFRVAATNMPVGPTPLVMETPKPVADTIEVAEAKMAHMAAHEKAKSQALAADVADAQVNVVLPIHNIAPAISTLHLPTPGGYSYSYSTYADSLPLVAPHSYIGAPVLAYSAPTVAWPGHPVHTWGPVTDTAEVVKARAEHAAAVEEVKARNNA